MGQDHCHEQGNPNPEEPFHTLEKKIEESETKECLRDSWVTRFQGPITWDFDWRMQGMRK
jgi:hypothetical protein